MSFYFLWNEWKQLRNQNSTIQYFTSVWNYIDVFPALLTMASVTSEIITRDTDQVHI
jgi:hypothetical protein